MAQKTLPHTLADPDDYLRRHLANETHWLLRAANEWCVQDRLRLNIGGYHVQVYAMDSAFLHARTLFEFLTSRTNGNHYGTDQFGISAPVSTLYAGGWKKSLHAYLMHAQERDVPGPLQAADGTLKDLNAMPVDFANEVTRLWTEFANALRTAGQVDRADTVNEILRQAILQAEPVLSNLMATRPGLSQE